MINKEWQYKEYLTSDQLHIKNEYALPDIISKVMAVRGLTNRNLVRPFFHSNKKNLHDPFLMDDMDNAVSAIIDQIKSNKSILVYGDYDVDGTTATAMLYLFFKSINIDVHYYIPSRENEGYGLSKKGIDYAKYIGVDLLITCDCGITAFDEVAYASSLGINIIITDHHKQSSTLPNALAIINPNKLICNYPFKGLCGAGVAFKFIIAISQKIDFDGDIWEYSDLAAIGTAADMVPILDENRIIVSNGLERINNNSRIGISALVKTSGLNKKNITVGRLSYWFAPKINAAGRLGDAARAVKLLVSDNMNYALKVANELENENLRRRDITEKIINHALNKISNENQESHSIILYDNDWHEGVIGIVASKIKEQFNKPTIIISINNQGIGKASCRSINSFDIVDALNSCSKDLIGFGGHPMAAGFSIKSVDIESFVKDFSDYAKSNISSESLVPKIIIDSEMNLSDISMRFLKFLDALEPFGPKNNRPIFSSSNIEVVGNPKVIGKNRDTIKFLVKQDKSIIEAIGFGMIESFENLLKNKPINIAYSVGENEWKGEKIIQLEIKDIKIAES